MNTANAINFRIAIQTSQNESKIDSMINGRMHISELWDEKLFKNLNLAAQMKEIKVLLKLKKDYEKKGSVVGLNHKGKRQLPYGLNRIERVEKYLDQLVVDIPGFNFSDVNESKLFDGNEISAFKFSEHLDDSDQVAKETKEFDENKQRDRDIKQQNFNDSEQVDFRKKGNVKNRLKRIGSVDSLIELQLVNIGIAKVRRHMTMSQPNKISQSTSIQKKLKALQKNK